MTEVNLPKFHRLARNVVSCSGYNGRGIAPAMVFERCLSGLVLGTLAESDLPLPVIAPSRREGASPGKPVTSSAPRWRLSPAPRL